MKPYFSHDEGARNDPKLVEVLMTLGHEGKSVYWDLVEMLYEQGGYLMLSQCKGYAFGRETLTTAKGWAGRSDLTSYTNEELRKAYTIVCGSAQALEPLYSPERVAYKRLSAELTRRHLAA